MSASLLRRYRRRRIARAVMTGMAAGLAATLVMDQFQKLWAAGAQLLEGFGDQSKRPARAEPAEPQDSQNPEDSTVKLADDLVQFFTGGPLSTDKKKLGGALVHYSFGTLMGGVYGAAVELDSRARAGYGMAFGAALFLGADEIGVPAVGLSPMPWKTPASRHVQECLAHLIYGAAAEGVRGVIQRVP